MKENNIELSEVRIYNAELLKDPNGKSGNLKIRIIDDYIKSKNYQKLMRDKGRFHVGGNILYELLSELCDYITKLFSRIRFDEVDVYDENRTLLFLRKFSRSSEITEGKIKKRFKDYGPPPVMELFELHITGLEKGITFSRREEQKSMLTIEIPAGYIYNRLISFMDKMEFSDLTRIDKEIRESFLKSFNELNLRVADKKSQIEMKYALELAQERLRDLEKENSRLLDRLSAYEFQNDLYKRSYFSLKHRNTSNRSDREKPPETIEELEILEF